MDKRNESFMGIESGHSDAWRRDSAAQTQGGAQGLQDKCVVVVDDELTVREGMKALLGCWGCDVVAADSLSDALARIGEHARRPDAIIADYRLREGANGVEVIQALHTEFGRDIPALLITGDTAPDRLREMHESGYAQLHKPVPPAKLRKVLNSMLAAAALALLSNGSASGQEMNPEDIIKYRKSMMTVQSWSLRPLAQMVKGERPYDKDLAARNTAMLAFTSKTALVMEGFPAGTEKGAETRAKPDIWKDAEKFKQWADRFHAETVRLNDAANAGTLEALRTSFGAVSKSCSGCHNDFRTK